MRPTLVVLGSGGHTAEMMALVRALREHGSAGYDPRLYVIASSDRHSESQARALETDVHGGGGALGAPSPPPPASSSSTRSPSPSRSRSRRLRSNVLSMPPCKEPPARFVRLPRSREVGQSWLTSVWSTLVALVAAFALVWREAPRAVLANGPGTCVPVCVAAVVLRTLRLCPPCAVVYCESAARVTALSLSGRILYRVADLFLVQWPNLTVRYPRARHVGLLV